MDNPPPSPRGEGVWGGGGQRPKKKFLYLKSASNFRPFDTFHFLPEENFSDVGGWVGWPGLARAPNNPPPPPCNGPPGNPPPPPIQKGESPPPPLEPTTKSLCHPPPPWRQLEKHTQLNHRKFETHKTAVAKVSSTTITKTQ